MNTHFQRDNLKLAVHDRGSGMPVVLQHGLCGDAAQPAEIFPFELPARCLTLECRGHGGSDAGDTGLLSIATFTDDLAAWLDSLALGPVVFGGISMGAAIALRLAVARPDLVRALVLARPAWVAEAAPANMEPNAFVGTLLARHDAEEARALFEASDTARDLAANAPDNLASLRGFFTREPKAVTAALLARISADGPGVSRADIAALGVPTLVVGTQVDAIHPLAHAETLAALIPGARLARITPKALDKPRYVQDFRAALAQFLSEISA
ncbi:alpha/beta hydrolase [Labrys okinawensis]|uniref:Alpha/beta hydrolase n=1 Tax=Labrys okinawensis TaxID=346911 RepID=A0A2S9QHJ2_9HYPH|nr:alpha/beta hydrolase [Labrys okinawensis]PRH88805.1 alpha/beta hydrolase [Labrys okinawensis]